MGKNVIISTLPNISQNYLPKVNTSNIFANSLVYDDGSSVLINTTTASAFRLDVNGTGRFQGALTGTSATFTANSTTVELNTSTRALKITGKDNYYPIECSGGTTASQSYGPYFKAGTNSSDQSFVVDNGAGTVNYFTIRGDGYTYFKGNVGIGVASPNDLLEIKTTSANQGNVRLYNTFNAGSSNNGLVWFRDYDSATNSLGAYIYYSRTGGSTGDMTFGTGTVGSISERMRIMSGGNVGINTTTPNLTSYGGRVLTISGVNMGAGYEAAIELEANLTTNDRLGEIAFINSAASSPKRLAYIECQRVDNNNAGFLRFATKDGTTLAERMRITSVGLVGIGNTNTSSFDSEAYQLVVGSGSGNNGITIYGGSAAKSKIHFADGTTGSQSYVGSIDYLHSVDAMLFNTNAGERMRITSVGDVCVKTNTASFSASGRGNITIAGDAGQSAILGFQIGGANRSYFFVSSTDTYIDNTSGTGNIVVLNGTGGVKLERNATSWISNSDERLKNINGIIENAIDKLNTLRAINFSWKTDEANKEVLGLIAQDVEKVFPQVVNKSKLSKSIDSNDDDETEYLGIKYTELVPVLVKAIQEQQAQIEEQKADIESLKALINK